jgi:hypothetical protein
VGHAGGAQPGDGALASGAVSRLLWPRNVAALPFDGDALLTVGAMWTPNGLAALARALPPHVALTADVAVQSVRDIDALLALHASRELSLNALTLRDYGRMYTAEARAALAAALAGRLGATLRHIVTHDANSGAQDEWLHAPLLSASAEGGAPALHTLEMRSASPAGVRYVASLLQGGGTAFSLKRLVVLMNSADAGALGALGAALPVTLHTLVLGVRYTDSRAVDIAAAALRALLAEAAARCPALRSAQLSTSHDDDAFVAVCRTVVGDFAAARPDVRASYRAYTIKGRMKQTARKSTAGVGPPFPFPGALVAH